MSSDAAQMKQHKKDTIVLYTALILCCAYATEYILFFVVPALSNFWFVSVATVIAWILGSGINPVVYLVMLKYTKFHFEEKNVHKTG